MTDQKKHARGIETDRDSEVQQQPPWKRSPCPVACSLDILGDKWTLLVVRDLLLGKQTFKEFQNSPEGIPTNILAERLKRLEQAGILVRELYQQRPKRYRYLLTDMGRELGPVLGALVDWGNRHLPWTLKISG